MRIADHADDDPVEDPGRPRDHVDVPVRHGVVGPGVDGGDHSSNSVRRAAPYLRDVRSSQPGNLGRAPRVPRSPRRAGRRAPAARRAAASSRVAVDTRTAGRRAPGRTCGGRSATRPNRVLAEHGRRAAELVEVRVDHAARVPIGVDERRARRAARERLEPERARAREQVEHVRVVDRADQVEHVLAHAVRGRTRVAPFGAAIRCPRWVPAMILSRRSGTGRSYAQRKATNAPSPPT